MRALERTGWIAVIALTLLTSGAAILRLVIIARPDARAIATSAELADTTKRFDERYNRHPVMGALHVAPALLFMAAAPLQFSKRIRARWICFHRWSGRILLAAGIGSIIVGLALVPALPLFGGRNAAAAVYFFGPIFLFCAGKAWYHVRRREIALHREWVIRTFAIALGASTDRVMLLLLFALTHASMEELFGISLWLGWSINLVIAETWINVTRQPAAVPARPEALRAREA
jgi:hypothetical protein